MSILLMNAVGQAIAPGATLTAVQGPHTGRHFRFVDIHDDGERIVCRHLHPHPFAHSRAVVHPSVFGLLISEEITRLRHVLNALHHAWQKVDEGVIMGTLALIPLALFEANNGAEWTRALLEHFGSH